MATNNLDGYYTVKIEKLEPVANNKDLHNVKYETVFFKTLEKAEAAATAAGVQYAEIHLDNNLVSTHGQKVVVTTPEYVFAPEVQPSQG